MRPYGGLIGKYRSASSLAANGMWVQNEHAMFKQNGAWPLNLDSDPYFNYTTLLLPGTGTNGANNNTFLDSSTNNFTVTRNGNTTQGTFSPFSQTGWGNYFNGSSALTMPNSTAFKPGSSDFSIELWYFGAGSAANQYIWGDSDSAANNGVIALRINPTSNVAVDYFTSSTAATARTTTGTINANAWNHICVSKTGTTLYIGINGVLETFVGPSSMQSPATVNPAIGRLGAYTASGYITGYISNFRYVVGSAIYTTNPYTVPKNNLTAISGTSLLTCQSNRFIDNSTNNFTITSAGSPSVVAFSPFAPTQPYSASAVGGSGYFDGSGDYLGLPTSQQIVSATGDLTIECFVYPTSLSSDIPVYTQTNGGASSGRLNLAVFTSGALYFQIGGSGYTGTSGAVKSNQWNFISATRTGSSVSFYVNGESAGSGTVAGTIDTGSSIVAINRGADGTANPIPVYYGSFRISNSVRSNLTNIPAAPYTSDTNTILLLNFTNAGIYDATGKNVIETAGDAQISTAQSKWGGGSMYFDGTGDWAITPTSPINDLSIGNWTIEFWIYPTTAASQQTIINFCTSASNYNGTNIWMNTSRQLVVDNTQVSQSAFSGGTLTLNTWNHVAITRISTTTTGYINGSSVGTNNYTPNSNQAVCLGYLITIGYPFNGYLSDLRITKGYARYTTNFSPPIRLSSIK